MTFSLVARCSESGMFGMAISSSSPAVAARCSYARAGVGAVASQNVTDPTLGPKMLDLLKSGLSAPEALARITAETDFMEYRQLLAVDGQGRTAIHSGPRALGTWSEAQATDVAAGGNLLATGDVPQQMVDAFLASTGHIGDRLVVALQAGQKAGGEAGPVHSAGLLIVDRVAWPVAELRCDWTEEDPIASVTRAWDVYKPQLDAYVQRAIDPRDAPSYGVPGDE
ncbi:DUF1028 domain-containing protein [Pelagovum pacificum]|uniref:DUF1028 domain-containing protein n=1 Tax=Pelagovum pacificum TaxID=2588711 RepID=A0A5C5GAZ9_9RHOB|nr:DUF1028 domain-containing protein [Pelagovum pacificum]QQA42043.1 DUF1028 domain-containing protein [Pelagovum pacificum]TNY31132.1 DUF1028 domain-containing protein [Pelagovum pacificum]